MSGGGHVLPGAPAGSRPLASPRGLVAPLRGRYLLGVLVLAGLYYGTAHFGYALEFAGPVAAVVWLPVGVGISFLYLGGLQLWPGVLVGDLLANNYSTIPVGSALGQTFGNVLEVLVVAALMRSFVRQGSPLSSIRGLGWMVAAIGAGTVVSATVGTLSLRLGGVLTASAAPSVWRTWWLGDACGALVLVPLAIAWYQAPPRGWSRGRALEAALMIGSVAGLSELALRTDRPLTYLVFPALIWAALRFGQRGATLAIAVAALFAVWETTHYVGPFVFDSITHSVLTTQLYIAVSAMTTLCLAAVVSEREEFGGRLRASRSRLVHAADTERQRLEHNLHDGAQQRLMAVVMRLRLGAERVEQSPETAAPLFEEAETELLGAIDDLRQLAHGIHPTVLTQFGLADAIKDVAARSAVPVELLELPATRLDGTAEATAYYVISEAVTNAQKHARATSIGVRATLAPHSLHIEVVDDGAGGANESGGSGLQGLRDRVEALGGEFEVDSPAGRGTRIAAAIPATAVAA